jgi:mRNA interferase RelE/StbE
LTYRIELTPKAERDFKSLDGSVRRRIKQRIDSLAENPFPSGIKKIEGEDELYRLRVGDYRILYQVKGKILLVLIIGIGHRRDIIEG